MEGVLSSAFVAGTVLSERRMGEKEDLRRGVFVAIYCSHGHQKDYELALPYLEKLIQEAEKENREVLMLLEQAGPSISIEEMKREIESIFGIQMSSGELLWNEKLITGVLKKMFTINQSKVIKEVEERGVKAVTNIKAEPLIEIILKHGLAVKLEESPFEAWFDYQREREFLKRGISLFLQGEEEGSLACLEKSVAYYLEALKTRDNAFREFIEGLFTRFPTACIVTLRGPLHIGMHKGLEKKGIEIRSLTVEEFIADTFSPFELLTYRLYNGEEVSSYERRETLRSEYLFEFLLCLIEKIEIKSSHKAKIVNQIVRRVDERERKELLEFLALCTSSGIFRAPEDPANAIYAWLLEKGKLNEEEKKLFVYNNRYIKADEGGHHEG